jgi:hypothetical protein
MLRQFDGEWRDELTYVMTLLARYMLVVSDTKKRIGKMLTPPSGSPGCQVLCVIAKIV